jgi:hypothetical protein
VTNLKKIKRFLKKRFFPCQKFQEMNFQTNSHFGKHHNRSQFIINSDTLDTNLGPICYLRKINCLTNIKNEVKLLMYSPVESDEIMNKMVKKYFY